MPKHNRTNPNVGSRRIVFKRVSIDAVEYTPEHVILDIDFPLGLRVTLVPGTGKVRVVIGRDGEPEPKLTPKEPPNQDTVSSGA